MELPSIAEVRRAPDGEERELHKSPGQQTTKRQVWDLVNWRLVGGSWGRWRGSGFVPKAWDAAGDLRAPCVVTHISE